MSETSFETLRERLPDAAKDLRLNLGAIARSEHLTERQLWGSVLAAAFAAGEPETIRAAEEEARARLDEGALSAVRAAHAVMAMNNVYYRFVHLASSGEYGRLPARLRMQALASPQTSWGVAKADFELWCLVVSAVNGCGACIDSHEKVLRQEGLGPQAIQDAVRAAAVVHGVARVLAAEAALAPRGAF